jgi:hypothetical protein
MAFIGIFIFSCCTEKNSRGAGVCPIGIKRVDRALYEYLTGDRSEGDVLRECKDFLDVFGEKVIGIGTTDSSGFFHRLKEYFSDSLLMELYRDEMRLFPADISGIERQLADGVHILQSEFDSIRIPPFYMHVSGLHRNVIVTENFISLSADKYLGSDYAPYRRFFYDYQLRRMTPDRVAPDYLLGLLLTTFPFRGDSDRLLDRMLYEGQIRYLLSKLIPACSDAEIVGYSDEQEAWCRENESRIWAVMLREKHLYTADAFVVQKYMDDAPFTSFLSDRSPGRAGVWIGYRIVQAYMKRNAGMSVRQLMQQTDYRAMLRTSGFRPVEKK